MQDVDKGGRFAVEGNSIDTGNKDGWTVCKIALGEGKGFGKKSI